MYLLSILLFEKNPNLYQNTSTITTNPYIPSHCFKRIRMQTKQQQGDNIYAQNFIKLNGIPNEKTKSQKYEQIQHIYYNL